MKKKKSGPRFLLEKKRMRNRLEFTAILLTGGALFCLPVLGRNAGSKQAGAAPDQRKAATAAPAPRHDVSGTWTPAGETQIRVADRGVVVSVGPAAFHALWVGSVQVPSPDGGT